MSIKSDCFAYKEKKGQKMCTALKHLNCNGCKFYHTKEFYKKNIEPLKYKSGGG